MAIDLEKRVAQDAQRKSKYMTSLYQLGRLKSWAAVRAQGVVVPTSYDALPFNYVTFQKLMFDMEFDAVKTYRAEQEASVAPTAAPIASVKLKLGKFKPFTFQQNAIDAAIDAMFTRKVTRSIMFDWPTGSGKTIGAIGMIRYMLDNGYFDKKLTPYKVLYFCPKPVVIKVARMLEDAGIPRGLVKLMSYSAISAGDGRTFYQEEECVEYNTPVIKCRVHRMFAPVLIVYDECHALKNWTSRRFRFSEGVNEIADHTETWPGTDNGIYQIWMSATPIITVANARSFVLSTKASNGGLRIEKGNFMTFARTVTQGQDPFKPNAAAGKRLRERLKDYIFSAKNIRSKHKGVNQTLMLDFYKPEDVCIYNDAHVRYIEQCEKAGKIGGGEGARAKLIALLMFRMAAELLRVEQLADLAYGEWKAGKRFPVIGVAFQRTLQEIVMALIARGMPRDKISIIWGGKREIKQSDLLTQAQISDILVRASQGEDITSREMSLLKFTIQEMEDRTMRNETPEEQALRKDKMRALHLFKQTPTERQQNVDDFQEGITECCIFTLAAGGVGLDLDHQHDKTKPRVGYFTPVYTPEEFLQALGRCVRIATISDTYQYVCYLKGTVEEYHVAPNVDKKLGSLQNFLARDEAFVDLLSRDNVVKDGRVLSLRSTAVAEAEAAEAELVLDRIEVDTDDEDEDVVTKE